MVLALVFVAGFAGGMVTTRIAVRHFVQRVIRDPQVLRDKIERRIALRLRLDPAQRAKAHEVLVETQQQLKDLRGEFEPRFLAVMDRAQSEIAATLTPEQRRRFEQLQAENRHWWQSK